MMIKNCDDRLIGETIFIIKYITISLSNRKVVLWKDNIEAVFSIGHGCSRIETSAMNNLQ